MLSIVRQAVSFLNEPIIVGGPQGFSDRQVKGGNTFLKSLLNGMREVQTERFLMVTSDLPCLTEAAVKDFLERCQGDALIYYPIIEMHHFQKAPFSVLRRTTLRLREGRFTGGNLAVVNKKLLEQTLPLIEQAYAARKNPLMLAKIVGTGTLFRVLLGQAFPYLLPLKALETAVGRFLREPVRAIITPYPEIGADIDDVEHYLDLKLAYEETAIAREG
jgi:2-phospho-L-lactate guanylyltransferase (CobY/MobA/RfbA family)